MDYKGKENIKPILVDIFLDTEKLYKENDVLKSSIEKSRSATKIYHENFRINKYDFGCDAKTIFIVNRHKSFEDAKSYIDEHGKEDKIAVLNFANATHAGGAVRSGSRAQEVSLCRCSTLYPCINTYNEDGDYKDFVYDNYYKYNADHHKASARVIYTPNVIVFKSDDDFPSILEEKEWYKVDVITCAANNQNKNPLTDEELYEDMLAKAHNIYNVAIDNNVDVLVLGAFGCGAFKCDPEIVARAFYDAYRDYGCAFKEIRFAIFCTKEEMANYNAFDNIFNEKINFKGYDKKLKYLDLNKETLKLINKDNLVAFLAGGDMGDIGARYIVLENNIVLYANVYYGNVISDEDIARELNYIQLNIDIPSNGWNKTCTNKGIINNDEWIMSYLGAGFFMYMKMSSNFYNELGKYLFVFDKVPHERMASWINLIDIAKNNVINDVKEYPMIKLFEMISYLHDEGYQKLRVMTYYSPSGCYFRCEISIKENFDSKTGYVLIAGDDGEIYRYSDANEFEYFSDGENMEHLSVEELSKKFKRLYPKIMEKAKGEDKKYYLWFKDLLPIVKTGIFPYAFEDMGYDALSASKLRLIDGNYIDFPPPGGLNQVEHINADALTTDADILLHQVNLQGVVGGGIAYQIAKKYPEVEKQYKEYKDKKLGNVLFVKTDKYVVGNCFSQSMNFDTDYDALVLCLDKVIEYMQENQLNSVAIPYKYGCGIANGDWNKVLAIFEEKFKDYLLKIYKLDK